VRTRCRHGECNLDATKPYWGYEDLGVFCLLLVTLGPILRLLERTHLLAQSAPLVQPGVILFLVAGLYAVLRLRHHQPVLRPLGWVLPRPIYLGIAFVLGPCVALAVTICSGDQNHVAILRSFEFFITGAVLAPILEESLFRGCLLPVLRQSFGSIPAVAITAVLFALFHGPSDLAHWASFTASGFAYGWLRLASRSTTAAALMHATYNLTLIIVATS
jgi:membrane protease YdiL (CAAX protease family)